MSEQLWTKDSYRERMEEIALEEKAKREKAKAAKAARPELKEECEITAVAYKIRDYQTGETHWESYPCPSFKGVFMGYRFKFNGKIVAEGEWDQNGFTPTEAVEVWLFVTDPRRNPIMAFPADVQKGKSND